jgi:hypothetical protein
MANTTDSTAKRLAALFNSGLGAELLGRLNEMEQKLGEESHAISPDWADPTTAALALNQSSVFDQAVITAFNKAGLDPNDPIHWKALMVLFSWAHFGKWPSRGRPPEWIKKHEQLLRDYYTIKNEKGNVGVVEVCRSLKKRYASRYPQTAERLAKQVAKAHKPEFNPSLGLLLDIIIQGEKRDHRERNVDWSPEIEEKKRKTYLEMILPLLAKKATAPASVIR